MIDDPAIHEPFARIHRSMYLLSLVAGALVLAVAAVVATSPGLDANRRDYVLGLGIVAALGVATVAIAWVTYFASQRAASLDGSTLHIIPWLRRWGFGRVTSVPLDTVEQVVITRPHHVELSTGGTRIRFGTFWWREDEYRRLLDALRSRGIEPKYRQLPGYGNVLSSW